MRSNDKSINNHHESAYATSTAMKEHEPEDTDKTDSEGDGLGLQVSW